MIVTVKKRDGREMPFNIEKISAAIEKAFRASGELDEQIKASQDQLNLLGNDDVLSSTALQVAASADPVGKYVAESSCQPRGRKPSPSSSRTPNGPSAYLMSWIPRRGTPSEDIMVLEWSIITFSSKVICAMILSISLSCFVSRS